MKVAVIGAGPTGLLCGKYCKDANFTCDIYEKTGRVGGVWVYTDETDVDEYGLSIHSSMYKELKTNLPKEVMQYTDYPYPFDLKRSYLTQPEVLQYFENFAEEFQLYQNIKFHSNVTLIESIENEKWLVKHVNVKDKFEEEKVYDAVIICNGHNEKPFIPNFKGMSSFEGTQTHSHYYRTPEKFTGKNVLVVGGGNSGVDISSLISKKASKVYLSCKYVIGTLSESVIRKPLIKEIFEKSVMFDDGTEIDVDTILYCTGFQYNYPFLSESCGIEVIEGKWVRPLYKHLVNIEHPTMAFIGITIHTALIPTIEIQTRFFLAYLSGHFQIPSKEGMLQELNREVLEKQEAMQYPKYMHKIGIPNDAKYYNDLALTANIKNVANVLIKIFKDAIKYKNMNIYYRIIDDENFEKIIAS